MHFAVYATCIKVHHRHPDLSNKQTGWLEAHHCVPYIVRGEPTPGAQTPWTIQMLWKSVGNWQQRRRWTLFNRSDIGLSPASRETSQTNKPPKYCTMTRGQTISSSLKKKRKHTQWVRAPIRSKSNKRRLTSLDLKANEVRLGDGWQVSDRSTESLDCLPSK